MHFDRVTISDGEEAPWRDFPPFLAPERPTGDKLVFPLKNPREHFVILSAGSNADFVELFAFPEPYEAREFYLWAFTEFEREGQGDDDPDDPQGCGFEKMSLFIFGQEIVSKSLEPGFREQMPIRPDTVKNDQHVELCVIEWNLRARLRSMACEPSTTDDAAWVM